MERGSDDEIYPNSPLVDVACEIRFPGDLKVECDRHLFWEAVRDEYPEILVPNAEPGKAPAMQHYRFQDSGHLRTVMVALHSLVYSESTYSGHNKFINEVSRLVDIFRKCFPKVDKLNRIGWRYVNIIPFRREEGLVPVRRFLKVQVEMPFPLVNAVHAIDARFEARTGYGMAVIRLANVTRKEKLAVEALMLDIDCITDRQGLEIATCIREVETLRAEGRQLFEQLITDDYRTFLRGKTL